jgi:hypothetical protein
LYDLALANQNDHNMKQKKYYDAPESELMNLRLETRILFGSNSNAPKATVETATLEDGSWD